MATLEPLPAQAQILSSPRNRSFHLVVDIITQEQISSPSRRSYLLVVDLLTAQARSIIQTQISFLLRRRSPHCLGQIYHLDIYFLSPQAYISLSAVAQGDVKGRRFGSSRGQDPSSLFLILYTTNITTRMASSSPTQMPPIRAETRKLNI